MSFPFPLFPSRFSLPSFPTRSSQWCLWLTRVPFFPSLCIPFPPPPFPLIPSLFPCWRSYSLPCSLLTIMFPPSFPIFDYAPTPFPYFWLCPDTLCPDVLMLLLQDCWKCNFCAVSAWVYGPDNSSVGFFYWVIVICTVFIYNIYNHILCFYKIIVVWMRVGW